MASRRKPDADEKPVAAETKNQPEVPPPRPTADGYVARTPIVYGVGDTRRRFEVGEELSGVDAASIDRLVAKDLVKAR